MPPAPFPITVIGAVGVAYPNHPAKRLSPASRQLLAALVAAGPLGAAATDLARRPGEEAPATDHAVRMTAARLRSSLPTDIFPRADDGVYRLTAAPDDVDVWRLEHLASGGIDDAALPELRHLLRPVDPYRDVVLSELLERSDGRIRRLQRELAVQVALGRPDTFRGEFVEFAVGHARNDPGNEPLVVVTAAALALGGDRSLALQLIRDTRSTLNDIGLDPSDDVAALERDLLDGTIAVVGRPATPSPTAPPRPDPSTSATPRAPLVPNQLRLGRTGAYVGDRTELTRLSALVHPTPPADDATKRTSGDTSGGPNDGPSDGTVDGGLSTVLLTGRSGAGKTRLCAEAAVHAADLGWTVLLVTPPLVGTPTPLAPMVAAMPELGEALTRVSDRNADADSTRLAMWNAGRTALEQRATERPLLMIVDDAQWLDDGTAEFLAHLVTVSWTNGRVVIVVNGRHDVEASDSWEALRSRLASLGAPAIDVAPLEREAMSAFVDDRRPGMNGALLAAVTDEILERSAGLPGVAGPLLAALPEGSAVLPRVARVSATQPLAPAIAGLSELARRVGIDAAVVGPRFRFDELQAVSSESPADLLDGLDELIDRDLVVDTSVADYEIAHALVEAALLDVASTSELSRAHLRAAEYHRHDLHRRAHHLERALPLGDADLAVAALRASANAYTDDGVPREAVRRFESVVALNPTALSPGELGRFARVLDLTGSIQRARAVRQEGFDRAAEIREWATALDVASSGLPEAEPIDGDDSIADQLLQIDSTQLGRVDGWRHAVTATRQLTIVGRGVPALEFAQRAERLAASPREFVATALARRFAMSGTSTPLDCRATLLAVDEHLDHVDELLLGDYLLNLALDHHQAGDLEASLATVERLERVPGRSAVKVWQGRLMRAMHHADAGELDAANLVRVEAHSFATAAGLGEADNALLAAIFVDQWLAGAAGLFVDEVNGGAMDPSRSLLTKAGASAVLVEVGEVERAARLAVEVAHHVLASSSPIGLPALVVAARALTSCRHDTMPIVPEELIDAVDARLAAHGNSMVVIAAGAANLGPVARIRADLARTDGDRRALLADAAELATRSGSPVWQALCPHPTA